MLISSWETVFFSSIEVIYFSLQLYFSLTKIKIKNWDLNVCNVIIAAVQQKVPTAPNIFPYKEMSPLQLLYDIITVCPIFSSSYLLMRFNSQDMKSNRIVIDLARIRDA